MYPNPGIILLFSGKRKSGKDYITNELYKHLGERSEVVKISKPIKHHWAQEKNLDLNELLSDSPFKEKYREEMIKWSDEIRVKDYGFFCKQACLDATSKEVWIVSDIRRKTDIKWFKEIYHNKVLLIRITADEQTRMDRGYVFKDGIDNVTSECDLDDYNQWNLVIDNGAQCGNIDQQLECILELLK